jgi:hypothetical protein
VTEILEVRQSALNDFELCGESFRRKHIAKEPALPGTAALRGGAVHVGAQVNHQQKRESHKDLPKKDIIDAAVAGFEEKKIREGFRLTPEELGVGVKPILARTLDTVAVLTGLYVDRVAPRLQPALVEQEASFSLPGGVKFGGRLDLSTAEKIVDIKTASRSKSQKEADESLQGTMYWLLYRALTGRDPVSFDLEVLVDLKTPKAQTLTTTRGPRDIQVLVNRANVMLRSIKAGLFAPAQVGSWVCCPKWCSFFDSCVYVNSDRVAAAAQD